MKKFRVWCKNKNEWERDTVFLTNFGTFVTEYKGKFKNLNTETHTIQFSTGFKDKNGIEIYEGDIVKGCGKHIGQSNVFYGDIGELQPMSYLNDYNFENYEVIGNIYENPEIINYI